MRIVLFFLLLTHSLIAQNDTILGIFSPDDTGFGSRATSIAAAKGGKSAIANQVTTGRFEIIVIDSLGKALHRRVLDGVDGFDLFHCTHLHFAEDRYFLLASANKNGIGYFVSASLDTTLNTLTIVDTLELNTGKMITFEVIKYNPFKSIYEGFGAFWNLAGSDWVIETSSYLSFDKNFHFQQFHVLEGENLNDYMLDFIWVETSQRWFVSGFRRNVILIDPDFNVLTSDGLVKFTYFYNNITYHTAFKILGSFLKSDGNVICLGTQVFGNDPYSVSLVTVGIQSDTLAVKNVLPFNEPSLGIRYYPVMEFDRTGEWVIAGHPTGGSSTSNPINIIKLNPNSLTPTWHLTFDNSKQYELWDIDIDEHNDIYLSGKTNQFTDGIQRGFMLKIFSNGQLSDYKEIPIPVDQDVLIFPNPAQSAFFVSVKDGEAKQVRLYDTAGRLVLEQVLISGQSQVNLPVSLIRGLYTAEVLFGSGQRAVQQVVVGN